jgi:hypothetical protein
MDTLTLRDNRAATMTLEGQIIDWRTRSRALRTASRHRPQGVEVGYVQS